MEDPGTAVGARRSVRWSERKWLSMGLRAFGALLPVLLSVGLTYFLTRILPPPSGLRPVLVRWVLLSALATGVLIGVQRSIRRLMPLTTMAGLNLVFPDRVPSRMKMALRTSSVTDLDDRINQARMAGVEGDESAAAESLLELICDLNSHDPRTRGHSERVRALSQLIAEELELPEGDRELLNWSALLHDVGKLDVPRSVLAKTEKLSEDDWDTIHGHPAAGDRLIRPLRTWLGPWADSVGQHHERWDGAGYPDGLAKEEISLAARIVAVADAFDAMTATSVQGGRLSAHEARAELADKAGSQFDPAVVRAFLSINLRRIRMAMGPVSWFANLPLVSQIPLTPAITGVAGSGLAALSMFTGGAGTQASAAPVPPPPAPIVTPDVEPPPTTTATTVELSEPDQPTRTTVTVPRVVTRPPRVPDGPDPPPLPLPTTPDLGVVVPEDDSVIIEVPSAGDASVSVGPDHGALSAAGDGRWNYRPDADYNGDDRMIYERCGGGGCSEGTVSIEVQPVNDPPVAVPDQRVVREDAAAFEVDVLANDLDKDGDRLSIAVVSGVSKGSATVLGDGRVRFDPSPDANGTGGFSYRVSDGNGGSSTTQVSVSLTAVNDAPEFTAGADETVAEDTGAVVRSAWASGLSPGPSDESGQSWVFALDVAAPGLFAEQPTVTPDGTLRYRPQPDVNGSSTVTVRMVDDGGTANGGVDTSPGQVVTITVTPVADDPVAGDDAYATAEDVTLTQGAVGGLLDNDDDVDGDLLTVDTTPVASPTDGALTLFADGSFEYVPDPDTTGVDTFTYRVDDGTGRSDTADVTVSVGQLPDPPVAGDDDYSTDEDVTLAQGAVGGLLDNDDDVDGDPLTVDTTPVTPPTDGLLTLYADGSFDYDPDPDFNGTDTFQYRVHDGTGLDDVGTVTITVDSVNDAPSFAVGSDQVVLEDSAAKIVPGWASSISPGPADESGQSVLFAVSADDPSLFSAQPAVSPAGDLTFTPAPDANGTTTLTVSVSDDGGTANGGSDTSADQTAAVTVDPVNDAPSFVAGPDQVVLEDSGSTTVPGWASSISPGPADESGQSVVFAVSADDESLFSVQPMVSPTGALSFEPAPEASGATTITVSVSDDGGTDEGGVDTSADQTATITITATNDDPVAADDPDGSDDPDEFLAVAIGELFIPEAILVDNDTDPEGDPLTLVASGPTATANGTVTCTTSGCTYDADDTYTGPDTFTYTVIDGNGGSDSATVTVQVGDYVPSPHQGQIVINEVLSYGMQIPVLGTDDFIELHNPTAAPIDISGWVLSDNNLVADSNDPLGGFQYTIPPGSVVPADDYAVIWIGVDNRVVAPGYTNVIGGGVLELYVNDSDSLAQSGDDPTLYDDAYRIVDHVAWGPVTASNRNAPIPASVGVWDTPPNNEPNLEQAGNGPSISLTPDGTFTADSYCWEETTSSAATCAGALLTVDTDTFPGRTTSVGRDNNTDVMQTGGPYSIAEGEDLVLDGGGPGGSTWAWDLDGDGQYDDATGLTPTVPWATLSALGLDDDGTYPIELERDGGAEYASGTLVITNTAPELSTTGAPTVDAGSLFTLDLSVYDPGDDLVTGWTINWGDGTVEQIPGNPSSVTHTFTNGGFTNNILVSATDEDGTWLQNELLVPTYGGPDEVFRFAPTTGAFVDSFAAVAETPIESVIGPDGSHYVGGEDSKNVVRHDPITGAFIDEFVPTDPDGPNRAEGMAFGPDGNLYVSSHNDDEVMRYDGSTGAYMDVFTDTKVKKPYGLVFGPDGNLYLGSWDDHEIVRFDGDNGSFIDVFVPAGSGGLVNPEQLTFGPDGHLYVASFGSDEVLRYDGSTGAFIDEFVPSGGPGDLDRPSGMAFGPDGHLYVSDHVDDNVLRFDGETGAFIDEYVSPGSGGLVNPSLFTFIPGHQVTVDRTLDPTEGVFLGDDGPTQDWYDALPTALPAVDPEPDHDGDGKPGELITKSSGDPDETDGQKYQEWGYAPTSPMELDGPVALELWSTAANFDLAKDDIHAHIYLWDCADDNTDCTLLVDYDDHFDDWNGTTADWVYHELPLGDVTRTIVPGRMFKVKVMFDHENVWVAMSGDRPTRLTWTPS